MNELDTFIKHTFKIKYYIRYADDFVILDNDYKKLENIVDKIQLFLLKNLKLELHPQKIFIKSIYSGVDFSWVGSFCRSQSPSYKYKKENVFKYEKE